MRQASIEHSLIVHRKIRPGRGCVGLALCLAATSLAAADPPAITVERNVAVPMRDGVILRADVYRPTAGGSFPVLVKRTPYGKGGNARQYARHVEAGYIVVCQDARGRYASDGQYESFVRARTHDAEDGYDTVEWAARLPRSTGKVGTFGASYDAFLQWRLAPLRPPSLVAMAAFSIPARYTDLEGPGSIRPGRRLNWWFLTISPDMHKRAATPGTAANANLRAAWNAGEGDNWLRFLPWTELPRRAFEDETPFVHQWLNHPERDPWKLDDDCAEVAVPNLDMIGWYDHCNGDIRLFRTMVERGATETARQGQRIIIGPWSHSGRGARRFGEIDFGPEAAVDTVAPMLRWFDFWLKGRSNGVDSDAPVKLFVMGANANRWRDEREWPLARAQTRTLYLAGGGRANTPDGDGTLVDDPPTRDDADHYRYDPRDPVPSLFGPACFTIPTDQRPLASRQDILVYKSAPLEVPLEVTGNPVVELLADSSAADTDFFVRLIDQAPDGSARDVAMGMVRARYRRSLAEPRFLEPGQVTKFVVRMGPTSNEFAPGHRLRLDVTSSDFPNYDRNHNTATNQNADATLRPADQSIHHGGQFLSRLTLPVIPRD